MNKIHHVEIGLDKYFSKYVSIWIWTMLFGVNSSVVYNVINTRFFEKDSPVLGLIIAGLLVFCFFFSVIAYWQLFSYLSRYIIPQFILNGQGEINTDISQHASWKIKHVVIAILFNVIFRILITIADITFKSLSAMNIIHFS